MRGFLYVEDFQNGQPCNKYSTKYFISYYLCGLKWFTNEPCSDNGFESFYSDGNGNDGTDVTWGWVYGSSVGPISVEKLPPFYLQSGFVYPFELTIQSGEHKLTIKFAATTEEIRLFWCEEIEFSIHSEVLMSIASDFASIPYPDVIESIHNSITNSTHGLQLKDISFKDESHWSNVITFYKTLYPYGFTIESIKLENVNLTDSNISTIASILNLCVNLQRFSIAENLITSKGFNGLCNSIGKMKTLMEFNISNNLIDDLSCQVFANALSHLNELTHLNISRNKFAAKAVGPLTLYLGTHHSKLKYFNASYNIMGDGIASLVALLLFNAPPHLVECDLAFCGLSDHGLNEIGLAIPHCTTLKTINLRGCYMDSGTLRDIIYATSDEARKDRSHSKLHSESKYQLRLHHHHGIQLRLAGILQQLHNTSCLTGKAMKHAFPYLSDSTLLHGVVLRKKGNQEGLELNNPIHLPSGFEHFPYENYSDRMHVEKLQPNDKVQKDIFICMRIQLPEGMERAEDVLHILSLYLNIHSSQLKLNSHTGVDHGSSSKDAADKLCFIVFFIEDWSDSYVEQWRFRTIGRYFVQKQTKNNTDEKKQNPNGSLDKMWIQQNYMDTANQCIWYPRTSFKILAELLKMAKTSDPLLCRLGIRSLFFQYPNQMKMNNDPNNRPQKQSKMITSHYYIQSSNGLKLGGNGLDDRYIPKITPKPPSYHSVQSSLKHVGHSHESEISLINKFAMSHNTIESFRTDSQFFESYEEEEDDERLYHYQDSIFEKLKDDDDSTSVKSNQLDNLQESLPHPSQQGESEEQKESMMKEKEDRQIQNERLILAVRNLYEEKYISRHVAKFWEGALGNIKYREYTKQAFPSAIDNDTGIFCGVRRRELLCDAMMRRDCDEINSLVNDFRDHPTYEGGKALILSQRLLAEIKGLQSRFLDLESMVRSYLELHLVEEFLLSCGVLGYSGPEMFQAVALRQDIVAQSLQEPTNGMYNNVVEDLPVIKYKALVSNLMISREVHALVEKMDDYYSKEIHTSEDLQKFNSLSETIAAKQMIRDHESVFTSLREAVASRNIDELESSLAIASYNYFYDPNVDLAIHVIHECSRSPASLLKPVLEGLRKDDIKKLEAAFQFIHRMGWRHEALDAVICSKIFNQKTKIYQDDTIRSKIIQLALAIRNGFEVKSSELGQLIRRTNANNAILNDPQLKTYLKTLNKKMKKFSGVVRQEKLIQIMIDQNDVNGLSKILSGRGSTRLLLAAANEFAMDEWMTRLVECCKGNAILSTQDDTMVFMNGILQKATRTELGLVKSWRKRYFVLHPNSLKYYTRARGGSQRGNLHLVGGEVRRLDSRECGGRLYCFELEEGRDLSAINPDLLEEARRYVRNAKMKEIEFFIRRGIQKKSLPLLMKMVTIASELEIMIDFDLMSEAKQCMTQLQEKNLKRNLYLAAMLSTREKFPELIALAEKLVLDPNLVSYRKVLLLSRESEIIQNLYKARGALAVHNEVLFHRTLKNIFKYDFRHFSGWEGQLFVGLILQYVGYKVLQMISFGGLNFIAASKVLKFALTGLNQLLVESESIDLTRLIISLYTRHLSHAFSERKSIAITSPMGIQFNAIEKTVALSNFFEDLRSFSVFHSQYNLIKYSKLRVHSTHAKSTFLGNFGGAIFRSGTRKKSSMSMNLNQLPPNGSLITSEILSFTNGTINQSLLKLTTTSEEEKTNKTTKISHESKDRESVLALLLFSLIQVIMGDRSISSLPKSKKGEVLSSRSNSSTIILDIIEVASVQYPQLRDEVYMQLAKQLSGNPDFQSNLKGWLLFSVFLHAFSPSAELYPYIANFVATSLDALEYDLVIMLTHQLQSQEETANRSVSVTRRGVFESTPERRVEGNQVKFKDDAIGNEIHENGENGYLLEDMENKKSLIALTTYCLKLITSSERNALKTHRKKHVSVLRRAVVAGLRFSSNLRNLNADYNLLDRNMLDVQGKLNDQVTLDMLACVFNQQLMSVEVILMTGSSYQFEIPYGKLSTPYSLLEYLYEKLDPSFGRLTSYSNSNSKIFSIGLNDSVIPQSNGNDKDPTSDIHPDQTAQISIGKLAINDEEMDSNQHNPLINHTKIRMDRILQLFRGFAFFAIGEDEFTELDHHRSSEEDTLDDRSYESYRIRNSVGSEAENRSLLKSDVDLIKTPIQPFQAGKIEWSEDLQWTLLLSVCEQQKYSDIPEKMQQRKSIFKALTNPGRVSFFQKFNEDGNSEESEAPPPPPIHLKVALRRNVGMNSEMFANQFELFDDEISEKDVLSLKQLWTQWLSRGEDQMLPYDYLRIDFLFAEDSRYINSRLYPVSDESFWYLLAIQMTLNWEPYEGYEWGLHSDVNHVVNHTTISVRPCYQFKPPVAVHTRVSQENVRKSSVGYKFYHRGSAVSLARLLNENELLEASQLQRAENNSRTQSHRRSGSRNSVSRRPFENSIDMRRGSTSSQRSRKAYLLENGSDSSDEDSVDSEDKVSESSSEYVSEEDSDEEEKVDGPFVDPKSLGRNVRIQSIEMLERTKGLDDFYRILKLLGLDGQKFGDDQMKILIEWINKFQMIAKQCGVPTASPRFRYMMKSAYVHYTMTCSLYGCYFTELTLMTEELELEQFKDTELMKIEVIVAVSSSGFHMLMAEDWSLLFRSPIYDIQDCSIMADYNSSRPRFYDDNSTEISAESMNTFDEREANMTILTISINSMQFDLRGEKGKVNELVDVIANCSLEMLSRGVFPSGSERDDQLFDVGSNDNNFSASSSNRQAFKLAPTNIHSIIPNEPKDIFKKFINKFVLLPSPPVPQSMLKSKYYFEAPKSKRELQAEARAEEERVEFELSRLAVEAHIERHQMQMKQGKEDIRKYRSDEDDNDEDAVGGGGGGGNVVNLQRNETRRRDVYDNQLYNAEEIRDQIQKDRLNAVVSGVSNRISTTWTPSDRERGEYRVPESIPTKIGNTIRFERKEKKRMLYKPVFHVGQTSTNKPSVVPLSWSVRKNLNSELKMPTSNLKSKVSSSSQMVQGRGLQSVGLDKMKDSRNETMKREGKEKFLIQQYQTNLELYMNNQFPDRSDLMRMSDLNDIEAMEEDMEKPSQEEGKEFLQDTVGKNSLLDVYSVGIFEYRESIRKRRHVLESTVNDVEEDKSIL